MLPQLLSLVLLVGLTAAALLLCFEQRAGRTARWPLRPLRRGGFGTGYWLCALLLLPVVAAYLRLGQLGVTAHTADLSFLFNAAPLYGRNLLGIALPRATGLLAAFPVALPCAALCRAVVSLGASRPGRDFD
jgi:hypothetical protein